MNVRDTCTLSHLLVLSWAAQEGAESEVEQTGPGQALQYGMLALNSHLTHFTTKALL